MSNEEKASEWLDKADKKLRSFSLFNSSAKYEDAADMYLKAANLFKLAKKCIWLKNNNSYIFKGKRPLELSLDLLNVP